MFCLDGHVDGHGHPKKVSEIQYSTATECGGLECLLTAQ